MKELLFGIELGGFIAMACCHPTPPVPDAGPPVVLVGDAGDDECGMACSALARAGCSEGSELCAPACRHAVAEGLLDLAVDCLANATTKAEARACRSSGGDQVVDCK